MSDRPIPCCPALAAPARAILSLLPLAALLLLAGRAWADPPLWTLAEDKSRPSAASSVAGLPEAARVPVRIDAVGLAAGKAVALPFPDGRTVTATAGDPVRHANGDLTLRLRTMTKGSVAIDGVLTRGRSGLFGRLRLDGRLWLVHSEAGGSWLIDAGHPAVEVDAFGHDALHPDALGRAAAPDRPRSPAPAPKDGAASIIDVMFIYPASMQQRYPGDLLDTRLNHLVAIANQALADSAIPAVVRLVLRRPTGLLPTEDNREMIGLLADALAGDFVPGLENLASIRDQFAADLVVLTWPHDIETRGSCGIAFFPFPADDPDPDFGVQITNDGVSNWSICSDAVFTHELGHNLNARHQQNASDDPDNANYAFVQLDRFHTVMGSFGTGDVNRFLRLDRFSNPDTTCGGGPCGSTLAGDAADNAAEMRRQLVRIAAYRGGPPDSTSAPAPSDPDSDGDGVPDSTDAWPFDPADGEIPAPPPPPTFTDRAIRTPGDLEDHELLVVDSERDAVLAWNLDGSFRGEAARPEPVDALPVLTEFSDLAVDGRGLVWLLASADVRRYDRATGDLVDVFLDSARPEPFELRSAFPRALGFDPDGGVVVLGDDAIERFDAQGNRRAPIVTGDPADPADWNTRVELPLRAFAFGPDGDFYLAEGSAGRILVFDGDSGERKPNLAFGGQLRNPRDLAFGPDGRLYVADDIRVVRYSTDAPGQPETFIPTGRGGLASARALAFGPDGMLYVVDRARGGVLRFDASTGAFVDEAIPVGALESPQSIAIAPKLNAVRPGHSGHWFAADRSGEGWLVEVLPNGRAAVLWFTYPAAGESDEQLWLTGAGTIEDDAIVIPDMLHVRGPRFGPGFDPADRELARWGELTLTFTDCRTGTAEWSAEGAGDDAYGSGSRSMTRLAGIAGLPCERAPLTAAPERPGVSGQWYDPAQDGQGWLLQEVRPNELFMAWFTYDDRGRPAWIVGSGVLSDGVATFEDVLITRGTRFGADFDPAEVERIAWGSAVMRFDGCAEARIEWTTERSGFVDGALAPVRLTRLDELDCADADGP
ncbi:hypothetical protein HFP89_03335 [Wenzhouxiangella sp. XN79A]|uniref:M12 family metallo-peptidase n=1 Tax=Wenzhouxiangella sp. XN79A TaxID=2724193 RepID=UPI00144A7D64|nr:zinc-dependent metalloprotease family protein [Wenzhouxiangella sp. XN79A]NKI34197.1 hypothetical protein [Wenzhouxiangella sp. XN79A]